MIQKITAFVKANKVLAIAVGVVLALVAYKKLKK